MPVPAMVEHLVGIQAQVPENPYVGLWSRLDGFTAGDLSDLVQARRAVRGGLMRGTLHLVTDREVLSLWPRIHPVLERLLHTGSPFGRRLTGLDVEQLLAAGRAWLEERPRTRAQLVPLLAERWPDHDAPSLAYALTYLLPLVQVTPRGLWRRSGPSAFTTIEAWLGQPIGAPVPTEDLLLRYLAAFGPAAVADMRSWSGLAGLRKVVEGMRPRLLSLRDERGRELFDLPDAPRPDPSTPAPVRFLPEYDNVLLGHADRSRFGTDERVATLFGERPIGLGSILVDGFLQGSWRLRREARTAMLDIRLVEPPSRPIRVELETEGSALVAFLMPEVDHPGVQVTGA